LTTEDRVLGSSELRAALERGRRAVVVRPPAVEHAADVWEVLPPRVLIVCPDRATAVQFADTAPADRRVHPITSLGRAARLLKAGGADAIAGTLPDLTALVAQSVLKLDGFEMVVMAWPEGLVAHDPLALDTLLAEAKDAARLFLSWDPTQLGAVLEQHAHRAPVFGDLPMGENARPLGPIAPARYTIVSPERRTAALREVIDALDPTPCATWRHGADAPPAGTVAVCLDLPDRAEFTALARDTVPVLVLSAAQLPYARTLALPLDPLPLPWALERGRVAAAELRTRLAERIAAGGLGAELAVLEPLFDRFDPAEVAAAALALRREPGPAPVVEPAKPWVKVWVGVGKRDRVGPKDLVGALVKEVQVDRAQLGRIDVTEAFAIVEVAPGAAERVIAGLGRVTLRGKRVTARLDRSGS
jgi:hypothetical protein